MEDPAGPLAVARLASPTSVGSSGDDWVIDYEKTGDAGWCGTGGCTKELWVSRQGRHVLVFSEQVLEWRLTPGEPAVLDIDIHGANCDATGAEPCLRRFVWNESRGRLDEAFNREGVGYLVGPLFQPIAPEPYPDAVRAEIARRDDVCRQAGGLVDDGEYPAVTSPDLNGDGRREWIVGSKYIGCHSPVDDAIVMPTLGVTVVVSAGDDWVIALTVQNSNYVVELRPAGPAEFGLRDEDLCQDKPGCPTRFYAWDPATATLRDNGEGRWSPRLLVNAETWLECLAAARAVARRHATAWTDADRRLFGAHEREMLQIYRARYEEALPKLTPADVREGEAVFARRYDEPQEQEAADWRNDLCVALS
nr:hypothetical protein [uncultured Brevundimonas sp.]